MKLYHRILLILYPVIIMFLSGVTVLLAAGWTQPLNILTTMIGDINARLILGGASALIFVMSLRLFFENFSKQGQTNSTIKETPLGEVRITLSTLEGLVVRSAGKVKGVREVKPRLKITPEGLTVFVNTSISPEVSMPVVSDELQHVVKETLEQIAGVKTAQIKIFIDGLGLDKKSRVD
ncbi:MAG: alkaline shock response membrane anchor protein AmaP [Bacillota bacterium]